METTTSHAQAWTLSNPWMGAAANPKRQPNVAGTQGTASVHRKEGSDGCQRDRAGRGPRRGGP
jgi:hypothetical protein